MTEALSLIDAHMHLWDLKRIRYPWLTPPLPIGITGDVTPIARNYLLDDYLADAAHSGVRIEKLVHIEAGAHPEDALAETRWLQALCEARGFPQAIVAHAQLEKPDVAALLEQHAAHAAVRGIRQILNWHPDLLKTYTPRNLLEDPAWRDGFACLARHGLSFDLQIYPAQMPAAARLAAQHPDTLLILNHTGMPVDRDDEGLRQWRRGMRLLAAQPSLAVKISGLAMLDWHWSEETLRPFVLETLDIFGAARTMLASNFPVDRLFGSFDQYFETYSGLLSGASPSERAALLGGTAARLYRI